MDLQLKGKRALVTGGSRGIGKAIARQLIAEGVSVAIAARGEAALMEAAAELGAISHAADCGEDASVEALVAAVVQRLGGIDILVNNAATPGGSGRSGRIADIDGRRLLEDLDIKVGGYLRTARAVTPHMVAAGWGRIINIGGLAARRTGNYVAAMRNASISGITKNLADELGPLGVAAMAIHPGAVRTEKSDAAAAERARATTSIGRMVEVAEIAWLVAMLASPMSAPLSGQTLQAGGGVRGTIDY